MALILTESFEPCAGYQAHNTTAFLENVFPGKWSKFAGGGLFGNTTHNRHGSWGIVNNNNNQNQYRHQVQANQEDVTFIYGHARAYVVAPTNQQYHVITRFLSDGGATLHVTVYYDSFNSRFLVARGDSVFSTGTLIYTGPNNQWTMDGSWHYFEIKCTLDDTAGVVELHIDGATIFSATGLDTKNGGTKTNLDTIELVSMDTNDWVDDIYMVNSLGSTNNTFLGDVVIEYLAVNNNGDVTGGIGSDGNQTDNYQLVNQWWDADYVDLVNSSDEDLYQLQDSGYAAPYATSGVIVYVRADKTDAGPRHFQIIAKGNGSTVNSADKLPTWGSYSTFQHTLETRPDGSPWTFADINAVQLGVIATD